MTDIIIAIIISIAFFIEGSIGFGGGIIAIPIIALFVDPLIAITIVLFFQFFKGGLIFFNYKEIDRQVFLKIVPWVILGTISGTFLVVYLSADIIGFALGLFVFLYVLRNRFFKDFGSKAIKISHSFPFGAIGGVIQGAFGTSGPIFAMFYNEVTKNRTAFRATLIATFVACNFIRIATTTYSGIINMEMVMTVMKAMPFFLLALYLAQKSHAKIPERIFMSAIDVLLLISSVSLMVKSII